MPTDQCTPAKAEVLASNKPAMSNNLVFIRPSPFPLDSFSSVPAAVPVVLVAMLMPLVPCSRSDPGPVIFGARSIRMHISRAIIPGPLPWPPVDDDRSAAPIHRRSHPAESAKVAADKDAR